MFTYCTQKLTVPFETPKMQHASSSCSDSSSCDELRRTSESKFCRICRLSDDLLVENVCECKGTIGQIHERCLRMWTVYQRSQRCEICRTKFRFNFDRKLLVKLYGDGIDGTEID